MAGRPPKYTTQDFGGINTNEVNAHSSLAIDEIERPDLIVVADDNLQSPHVQEYIKDSQFMEDKITFSIGDTTEQNAERVVSCGVNGERKDFERGREYVAARKFVDSLIKRKTDVNTKQYKDNDGVDQTEFVTKSALVYPISIIHDPAGDVGRRWFRHACENAW